MKIDLYKLKFTLFLLDTKSMDSDAEYEDSYDMVTFEVTSRGRRLNITEEPCDVKKENRLTLNHSHLRDPGIFEIMSFNIKNIISSELSFGYDLILTIIKCTFHGH